MTKLKAQMNAKAQIQIKQQQMVSCWVSDKVGYFVATEK